MGLLSVRKFIGIGCVLLALTGAAGADAADLTVRHYGLDISLDPASRSFAGSLSVEFTEPDAGNAALKLDMAATLNVESVFLDGQQADFSHQADILAVQLPIGDLLGVHTVTIRYRGGADPHGLRFYKDQDGYSVASFGMPYTAMHWWPVFDSPGLKAHSADIRITLPADMVAVSNGTLEEVEDLRGGLREYHWHEVYPIYPDMVSIAAASYTKLDASYRSSDGTEVPLRYYVFKEDAERGKNAFAFLPSVLKVYEDLFGPYPFAKEKFGIAEVAFPSFREHQTVPSLGRGLLQGTTPVWDLGNVANVMAHDLAHQWFGNSLTPASWSDVWLNEGFATYAVALWHERDGGQAAYRSFMQSLDTQDYIGSVYIQDEHDVAAEFTSTTFNKAAWVLHMLRHVMGDQAFFAALHDYATSNRYGQVDTARWLATCEQHYGKSLGWFFKEWIYGTGEPVFRKDWSQGGGVLRLRVAQVQPGQVFSLPLEVEIQTDKGSTRQTVWLHGRMQTAELPVQGTVRNLVLDPDGWVLKGAGPQEGAAI